MRRRKILLMTGLDKIPDIWRRFQIFNLVSDVQRFSEMTVEYLSNNIFIDVRVR